MALRTPYSAGQTIKSADTNNDLNGLADGSNDLANNSLLTFRREAFADFNVLGGGQWTQQSGLIGQRNASVNYISGVRLVVNQVASYTFSQSQDTYVDIDGAGQYHYTPVTNGAAAPALVSGWYRDAIVITGTAISQIIQFGTDSLGNYVHNTAAIGANQAASGIGATTGDIKIWAGTMTNVPSGWLPLIGQEVKRSTYISLFKVIGTAFGGGDGSTTFLLPSFQSRTPVGYSANDNGGVALQSYGGENRHTMTYDELVPHSHSGGTDVQGNHDHRATRDGQTVFTAGSTNKLTLSGSAQQVTWGDARTDYNGNHSHNFQTNNSGNGNSFNIMQQYVGVIFIIKT